MSLIKVIVKPNSKKNEMLEQEDNCYKIAIKAHPEKGKANKELIKFLHKLTKKKVTIISGLTSREKIVKLE